MKHLKLFFALFAMLALGVGNAWGDVTCDFTVKSASHSAYTDSWSYGDFTVFGGANNNGGWAYVKMGGKSSNLESANPVYIASPQMTSSISKVQVSIFAGSLAKTGMSVNSWGVYVYSDENMTTQIDYVAGGTIDKTAKVFEFTPSEGTVWAANNYYKVSFDLANTSTTNGIIWLDKITFVESAGEGGGETPDPEPEPEPEPTTTNWVATDIANISATDVVVVTMSSGSTTWALTSAKGSSSAPTAVAVTVANDGLTEEPADALKWNISNTAGSLTIYPNGTTAKWLYCTNSNNGVRVGTNEHKTFTIEGTYLKHTGTSRYIGVYNSQDWRCYTNTTGNTAGQTLKFYKYVEPTSGGEGEEPTIDAPTFSLAAGKYNEEQEVTLSAEEGTIYYTLDGTTPTADSEEYTEAIVLDECGEITIKAIAISGEITSSVASATYTIKLPLNNSQANPYTEAEAIEVYNGGCYDNQEVYVKGVVANAQFYNSKTYTITLEDGFQFYYFYEAADDTPFTEDYIETGDTLVACGKLSVFNSKYQLAKGCYLVERKAYSVPKVDISNTPETAYTVAEAIALIDNVTSDLTKQVYVKGEISEVESFDDYYGSITYWIKDEAGNTFQCYSGLGLNSEKFESVDDLVVGSQVVVYGTLKKHNSTYEFNYNNYIVSLTLPSYTVTVSANLAEAGTVTGGGSFEHGAEATLTATANDHYVFVNWTKGEEVVSTENPYTFNVTDDVALVANFKLDSHIVTVTAENGTVTGADTYEHGATATLTATPAEGYEFVNWTENEVEVSTAAEYTFEVLADHNLVANFEKLTYTVTATATNGTVEGLAADGKYEHGAEATLTATANEGYEFVNWTSDKTVVSTENPYKFTVTADVDLVANFKEKEVAPTKLYLTPNANWKQSNARFAAYFFGNGETWVSMTKVAGETDLYEVTIPTTKKYPNVIFCRMNPSASANNWNDGVKWNQTADLVIPTDGKNHYTVKEGTWDKGGGTWSIWPVPTVKTYVDITITVIANAPASIKWANAGDKLADATEYVAMTAGENNTYTYTLAQVDEAKGVDYTIKVGDIVSTTKNTSKNVTVDFKNLLPQVAIEGIDGKWDSSNKMTVSDDYLTASITLPLAAKDHAWKLTIDAAWLGGSKFVITRTNNSVVVKEDAGGDGKLTADIAGDYVFTWTYASQTLTVAYPVSVTATAENGIVEGAGTYTHGTEVTLTATPAEGYEFVNWTIAGEEVAENPYTFTVTADVVLVANFTPTLPTEIKISGEATHTEYNFGEQFDVTGLVVTAVYSDKEVDITEQVEWTMSPLTIGTTAVEVKATYGTFSATKTCNVTVHVPHNKVITANVLNGIFLVSDTKAVKFSTGNLQYNCGTYTWSFAEEQYEIIGGEAYDGTNNTNYGMNVPGYTGKLDLFAWSCESSKYGVNPSNTDADYTGAFVDWGTLVEETGWYTLTQAEMQYLLNQKKDGKALWTFASIEGIKGLMLMPYNWDVKMYDDIEYGYAPKDFSAEFEHNVFTAEDWVVFQGPGAAFLPTAGSRTGGYGNKENAGFSNQYDENGHYFHVDNVNDYGYYWLNTEDSRDGYQHCASYLIFPGWSDNELKDDESDDFNYGPTIWSREKRRGNSVRLVKETTLPEDAPTDILNLETGIAPQKIFMNGQLIIIKNGVQYNAQGQVVK